MQPHHSQKKIQMVHAIQLNRYMWYKIPPVFYFFYVYTLAALNSKCQTPPDHHSCLFLKFLSMDWNYKYFKRFFFNYYRNTKTTLGSTLVEWSNESVCACVWHAVVTELLAFSAPLSTTAVIRVVTEILSQSACSQMALARLSPVFQMSVKNWRGDAFSLSPLLALPPLFLPVWPCVKKLSGKSKYGVAISPNQPAVVCCVCV